MFRKHARKEADARISHVEMLERINYGTATVRVTYSIQPGDGSAFDVVQEAKVKMATLPQAGQEVRVSYDPEKPDRLEVLTPPGQETGAITERTKEIPYRDWRMPHATEGEVQHLRERVQQQQPDALLEKLRQLGELRDSGVLTEDEFEAQKARLLAQQ
jgi:Short C-terminal domain